MLNLGTFFVLVHYLFQTKTQQQCTKQVLDFFSTINSQLYISDFGVVFLESVSHLTWILWSASNSTEHKQCTKETIDKNLNQRDFKQLTRTLRFKFQGPVAGQLTCDHIIIQWGWSMSSDWQGSEGTPEIDPPLSKTDIRQLEADLENKAMSHPRQLLNYKS